jgi:hypothetical protein
VQICKRMMAMKAMLVLSVLCVGAVLAAESKQVEKRAAEHEATATVDREKRSSYHQQGYQQPSYYKGQSIPNTK